MVEAKSSTLAWHHNINDLMLDVSCSLESSERVITEHRNLKATEETMASGSSIDASSSSVSMEFCKEGINIMLKVSNSLVK